MNRISLVMVSLLLAGGCATSRPRAAAERPRAPVSAPQRLADQRAVDPNLHAEDEERRFGLAEARARKAEQIRKAREEADAIHGADVVKHEQAKSPAK
jgi:hypothetical protein